jgi:U3 small nucleolar RNA-associated protein 20
LLPWHQYEAILRFYLTKLRHQLDFQKQLVRTVVAILDAFHFDLSRAQIYDTQDKNEDTKTADVELMEAEKNEKEAKITNVIDPSGKIPNSSLNGNDEESGETGVNDSVEADASKTVEGGPEELADRLESLLDLDDDGSKVEEVVSEAVCETAAVSVPAVNRETVLNRSVATHVVQIITAGLLPQIHRVMAHLTQAELSHKLNKKQTASDKEEEGILRVPIAVAAVKLLQHLPSHMLDQNLPG